MLRSGGRKSLIVESFAGEVEVPDIRVGAGDRDGHVAEDDGPRDLLVERRSRYSLHRALISFWSREVRDSNQSYSIIENRIFVLNDVG